VNWNVVCLEAGGHVADTDAIRCVAMRDKNYLRFQSVRARIICERTYFVASADQSLAQHVDMAFYSADFREEEVCHHPCRDMSAKRARPRRLATASRDIERPWPLVRFFIFGHP
jgi:hypothetical protein